MQLRDKPGTDWATLYEECQKVAPEAFDPDQVRHRFAGRWQRAGTVRPATSPIDATPITGPAFVELEDGQLAIAAACEEHRAWTQVPLAERKARVEACLDDLVAHRDLIALLLMREIGKTWSLGLDEVDRTDSTLRWYLERVDDMLRNRAPLPGPVSNIASWNYPVNVLFASMLVQALAGNGAVAKVPTDGGLCATTLATVFAARAGLPFTLVAGSGSQLSPALVLQRDLGCVAFVGGRDVGGRIAGDLVSSDKRHMLEQEGLNTWGVWEFSDWPLLQSQIRAGFKYAKQRCTAYPRYVVQRRLFADFLEAYLPVVRDVSFGNPFGVARDDDSLPDLDYGPLIKPAKARELREQVDEAIGRGGIPLYLGEVADGRFVNGQDRSAYMPPMTLLEPPRSSPLYHAEPFGPVDTIVLVDSEAQMLAEMNASNGALVASLAMDDVERAHTLAEQLRAFKVGINRARSRGDRDEPFGGWGASWKGAFVGGDLLVHAVTVGEPGERLYGNFIDYKLSPPLAAVG